MHHAHLAVRKTIMAQQPADAATAVPITTATARTAAVTATTTRHATVHPSQAEAVVPEPEAVADSAVAEHEAVADRHPQKHCLKTGCCLNSIQKLLLNNLKTTFKQLLNCNLK